MRSAPPTVAGIPAKPSTPSAPSEAACATSCGSDALRAGAHHHVLALDPHLRARRTSPPSRTTMPRIPPSPTSRFEPEPSTNLGSSPLAARAAAPTPVRRCSASRPAHRPDRRSSTTSAARAVRRSERARRTVRASAAVVVVEQRGVAITGPSPRAGSCCAEPVRDVRNRARAQHQHQRPGRASRGTASSSASTVARRTSPAFRRRRADRRSSVR